MNTTNNQENKLALFGKFAKKSDKVSYINGNNSIIYTRVSSREQQEKNMSLSWQKKYCEELCQRNNYNIISYFGGTYESAKTDERKEFKRMLEFIRKSHNKVSNIIVYSLDRFSRAGSTWLIDQLRGWGVRIVSVTQPADANTANGRWFQKMQLLIAELDNEQRKDKCVTGMREKLMRGEWIIRPPFGYKKILENGKIRVVKSDDAKFIRKAFQWKIEENLPHTVILDRLLSMGCRISHSRLTVIFRNPFYCGLITNKLIDGKVIKGEHEAIIPEEMFLKVNGLLAENHQGYKHQKFNDQLPLKIFVKCADCGSSFCGYEVKKKKLFYYKCKKKGCKCNRSMKHMHALFENVLMQYTLKEELIEPCLKQIMNSYVALHKNDAENEKLLKCQITEVEKNLAVLRERWALGKITEDVYKEFSKKYEEQKSKVEAGMQKISPDEASVAEKVRTALGFASNLLKTWQLVDYSEKQRLQYLVFPQGMQYDRKTDTVRTNEVNSVFRQISLLNGHSEGEKNKTTNNSIGGFHQVGVGRFELPASTSRTWRANRTTLYPDR